MLKNLSGTNYMEKSSVSSARVSKLGSRKKRHFLTKTGDAKKFHDYALLAIRKRLPKYEYDASKDRGCVITHATKEDSQKCNSKIKESLKETVESVGWGFDSFIKDEPVECSKYHGRILPVLETCCTTLRGHEICDPFRKMQDISRGDLWPQLDGSQV